MELTKYRDIWLGEKFDEFIGFYTREFFCLDNFSAFKVLYDGVLFDTVEHAYQAEKFKTTAPKFYNEIIKAYSPYEAQKIAHSNDDLKVSNWDEIKLDLMEKLLRLKLEQNPFVKQKLLQTKDYLIAEDSPTDNFWGIGKDRKGQNQMGKLWMKIRAELTN